MSCVVPYICSAAPVLRTQKMRTDFSVRVFYYLAIISNNIPILLMNQVNEANIGLKRP